MPTQSLLGVQDHFFSLTLSSNCFRLPPGIRPHGKSRKKSREKYARHSMPSRRVCALKKKDEYTGSGGPATTHLMNGANKWLPIQKCHTGTVSRIFIPSSNTNNVNTNFGSQKQVSWFYISVDKAFGVDIPNCRNLRKKEECTQAEGLASRNQGF